MDKFFDDSWAILIGIGTFSAPEFQADSLATTKNDVNKMKEILLKCGYAPDNIIEVLDSDATSHGIRYLFDSTLPSKIKTNDRVLIFYTGHGITRPPDHRNQERGYIATYDAKRIDGEIDWQSILKLDEFIQFVETRLPARQILFLMDCCFSGLVHKPPEYEAMRGNLCPADMINAAKTKKTVQIFSAANKDEMILASSGVTPPISVFVESIERVVDSINPNDYPEKFLSAYKLSQSVTLQVRETSIFSDLSQNPVYYFSTLDNFGEFVFKQFSQQELDDAIQNPEVTLDPIEKAIKDSPLSLFFTEKNLIAFKRLLERRFPIGYSLLQLRKEIPDMINNYEPITTLVDKQIESGIGFEKEALIKYMSENIIALGLHSGLFGPKFVQNPRRQLNEDGQ